jgi:hypothetical protein
MQGKQGSVRFEDGVAKKTYFLHIPKHFYEYEINFYKNNAGSPYLPRFISGEFPNLEIEMVPDVITLKKFNKLKPTYLKKEYFANKDELLGELWKGLDSLDAAYKDLSNLDNILVAKGGKIYFIDGGKRDEGGEALLFTQIRDQLTGFS